MAFQPMMPMPQPMAFQPVMPMPFQAMPMAPIDPVLLQQQHDQAKAAYWAQQRVLEAQGLKRSSFPRFQQPLVTPGPVTVASTWTVYIFFNLFFFFSFLCCWVWSVEYFICMCLSLTRMLNI